MYTTSKLSKMPYAQAHIRHYDDGALVLVSYSTPVVTIDNEGWLSCSGLYSMTTRKHISAFANEFCFPLRYVDIRNAYERGYIINIHTGEIKFLADME